MYIFVYPPGNQNFQNKANQRFIFNNIFDIVLRGIPLADLWDNDKAISDNRDEWFGSYFVSFNLGDEN